MAAAISATLALQLVPHTINCDGAEPARETDRFGAHTQPGLRSERTAGEDDAIHAELALFQLAIQLLDGRHETHRTELIRCAHRNQMRMMAGGLLRLCNFFGDVFPRAVAGEHHLRAQQMVEQQVAVPDGGRVAAQHDDAPQAASGCGCSRLPAVVGLHPADGDQGVRSLAKRLGHREFELARLVPAAGQTGQIVALDEQARPPQCPRQTRQLLQRGREIPKANAGQMVSEHGTRPPK